MRPHIGDLNRPVPTARIRRSLAARALSAALVVVIAAVALGATAGRSDASIEVANAAGVSWSSPITISAGGTYSGNWSSSSTSTPAVKIATTQPVIIENCNIQGPGVLILDQYVSSDVTVRNCNVTGTGNGTTDDNRFIKADSGWRRLTVTNNTITGTTGIWMNAPAGNTSEAVITNNSHTNVAGSNYYTQFAQVGNAVMGRFEIAWNQIINTAGVSRVEDNINIYSSGGVDANHPLWIHDNFIWGGFPANPATNQDYSGGGIMIGDGGNANSRHVLVENNQIVGTSNYGISIVCGTDQIVRNNTVLASGKLSDDTTWVASMNVGLSMASDTNWGGKCPSYERNSMTGNDVAWVRGPNARWAAGRSDWWTPSASGTNTFANNTALATPTYATERAELTKWQTKLAANSKSVGVPTTTTTTTAAPTTTTTAAPTTTKAPTTSSSTTTTAAPTTTTTAAPPSGVTKPDANARPVVGDFDGDGRQEIYWYGPNTAPEARWEYNANRKFVNGTPVLSVAANYLPHAGDFDGDGRTDILWFSSNSTAATIWFGRLDGNFTPSPVTVPAKASPVIADFDGDGRADVIWNFSTNATPVVWWGNANRTFTTGTP